MVGCHQSLLLVAPLEEREVNNPQTFELVFVSESESVAHFKSQAAELYACLVGIVAAENKNEVARLCVHFLYNVCEYFRRVELVDAALCCTVFIDLYPYESLCSDLWFLHEVSKLVELFSCIVCTSRCTYSSDVIGIVEYGEFSSSFQYVHEFHEFHSESQVWLVASESAHSVVPCHLLELCR